VGTWLLSNDDSNFVVGDLWSVVAAVFSAAFILRLESFSRKYSASELNGVSFITGHFHRKEYLKIVHRNRPK